MIWNDELIRRAKERCKSHLGDVPDYCRECILKEIESAIAEARAGHDSRFSGPIRISTANRLRSAVDQKQGLEPARLATIVRR